MSATSEPQIVYGIEQDKDGEIESLLLSQPDAFQKEKIAYNGACKNIGDGLYYSVYDKKGVRHRLVVNDKGEIVTDDDQKLNSMFDKAMSRDEIRKMERGDDDESKLKFSKSAMEKEEQKEEEQNAAGRGSNFSAGNDIKQKTNASEHGKLIKTKKNK